MQVIKATYWQGNYSLICTGTSDRNDLSEMSRNHVNANYLYFLLKILDLLDSVSLAVSLSICRRFYIVFFVVLYVLFCRYSFCFVNDLRISHFCMCIITVRWL